MPEQQTADTFLPGFFTPAYVSPFSKPQLTQQLVPLIGENIKQRFREFVDDVDDGIEFLANVFSTKEKIAKQTLKKIPFISGHGAGGFVPPDHGFKPVAAQYKPAVGYPNYPGFPDLQPIIHTTVKYYTKKPYYRYASDGSIAELCSKYNCSKANKIGEDHEFLKQMGINKYMDFEKNVLRNLEQIEEEKVEAKLGLEPSSEPIKFAGPTEWVSSTFDTGDVKPGKEKKNRHGTKYTSIISSSEPGLGDDKSKEVHRPPLKKIKKLIKKTKPTQAGYAPISGPLLFNNKHKEPKEQSYHYHYQHNHEEKPEVSSFHSNHDNIKNNNNNNNGNENGNFLYKHEEYYEAASDQSKSTETKILSPSPSAAASSWKPVETTTKAPPTVKEYSAANHHRFRSSSKKHSQQESKISKTYAIPKQRTSSSTTAKTPTLKTVDQKFSSFVDKVRASGKRGSVKFNPKNSF